MSPLPSVLSPLELLRLSPAEADRLLGDLERSVPVRAPLVEIPEEVAAEAIVFGDSHGDWRSTEETVRRFEGSGSVLVGLGDYIDRAPEDCGEGSIANALLLLQLAAAYPERVYLIQGNHEMTRRIPVLPHTLPREVDALWGPDRRRYDRLLGLLERGPIAAYTRSGAYLAHAGFPRSELGPVWTEAYRNPDLDRLAEVGWAECAASEVRRGAAPPWDARDLERFLQASGLAVVLRGHDPDLTGRPLYHDRVLTLHTCRVYERYGGVLVAHLPLRGAVRSVADLRVEHLPTEGRTFPRPPRA